MKFAHFEIKVDKRDKEFVGSWRACLSHSLSHQFAGQSNLPLGKTITQGELEEFAFVSISKAAEELEQLHESLAAK